MKSGRQAVIGWSAWLGTPVYGPPARIRALGNLLPAMATGPSGGPRS